MKYKNKMEMIVVMEVKEKKQKKTKLMEQF
jgi:hypothetical protein